MTNYIQTREKTKAIKKRLVAVYGAKNVSVLKGTGTASHWITSTVYIERPSTCICSEEERGRWPNCDACRAMSRETDQRVEEIAALALQELGAVFGTYYSDDYTDSTPHDCHLINIYYR